MNDPHAPIVEPGPVGELGPIVRPGRNCWRHVKTERLGFLIDADAYFRALKRALLLARRQVILLGWDLDGRVRLERRAPMADAPNRMRDLLNHIVALRPELRVHLLLWKYPLAYAVGREPLPLVNLGWRTASHVQVRFDATVPVLGCHHQKVVVIDDSLAFVGGMDIAARRWDTPEHALHDPGRVDGAHKAYRPTHDVQVMLDGEAAAALGDLARDRWRDATGEKLARPGARIATASSPRPPWPETADVDLRGAKVAIARTVAELGRRRPVQEVKRLHLDAIAAARRHIYIESQYVTAETVVAMLSRRLAEPDGPEVVMVMPETCRVWLEEITMGVGLARRVQKLRAADRYDRLRLLTPALGDEAATTVLVHSKVMVVDDRLARVGSANLNNRSMGYDSECDVAIEAVDDPVAATAIAAFRNRLIAEHMNASTTAVAHAIHREGSLIGAIDALRRPGRCLRPIEVQPNGHAPVEALAAAADPRRPGRLQQLLARTQPERRRERSCWFVEARPVLLLVVAMTAMAMTWHVGGLSDVVAPGWARKVVEALRSAPGSPGMPWSPGILGVGFAAFAVAGALGRLVPVFFLAGGAALGFWGGLGCGLAGVAFGRALARLVTGSVVRLQRRHAAVILATTLSTAVAATALGVTLERLWWEPRTATVALVAALFAGWFVASAAFRRLLHPDP